MQSEEGEYFFRGTLQRLFNTAFAGRMFARLRVGTLLAALLFGVVHLDNVIYQPIGMTVTQVIYALMVGLILGSYYDAVEDLAGAAWLHNILDGGAFLVTWLFLVR